MQTAIERITAAFPDMTVTAHPRPDGGYLMTFVSADGVEIRRVVAPSQAADSLRTDWLISAIRRDMALQFGRVPPVESLRKLRQGGLPSYTHL